MTNKLEITREHVERLADRLSKAQMFKESSELRALLAAPAVERQVEPVAYAVFADNGNIRCWSRTNTATGLLVAAEDGAEITPLYASPPAPVSVVLPEPEKLFEVIAEALGEALDCTRVWSAWGVGTMSEDDFVQVADQSERLHEIASACLDKLKELNQ